MLSDSSMSSAWQKPVSEIKQILKVHKMSKDEFISQYIAFMRYCWSEVSGFAVKMPSDDFLAKQIGIFLAKESDHLENLYQEYRIIIDENDLLLPVDEESYENEHERLKSWATNLIEQLRHDPPWTSIKKTPKTKKSGNSGASPKSKTMPKQHTQDKAETLSAEGYKSTPASTKGPTKTYTATPTSNIQRLPPPARPRTKTWGEINYSRNKEAEDFDREFVEFAKAKDYDETMITNWLQTKSVASKNINNMYEMFGLFQDDIYLQRVLNYDFDGEFTKSMKPLGYSKNQISSFLALQDKADKIESNMHKMQNAFLRALGSNERVGSMNTLYDTPHAPTYAAPVAYAGPHGMTYAAPVAYADPHGMTYAAPVAYAGPHAMTYAAPVQYGDGHGLTCAAPYGNTIISDTIKKFLIRNNCSEALQTKIETSDWSEILYGDTLKMSILTPHNFSELGHDEIEKMNLTTEQIKEIKNLVLKSKEEVQNNKKRFDEKYFPQFTNNGSGHGGACAGLAEKEQNLFWDRSIPGLSIYFSNGDVFVKYQNKETRVLSCDGGIFLQIDIQKDATCNFEIEFPSNRPYRPDIKWNNLKMNFVVALAKWYQKLHEDEKSLVFRHCTSEILVKSQLVNETFKPLLMPSNSEIMDQEVAVKTKPELVLYHTRNGIVKLTFPHDASVEIQWDEKIIPISEGQLKIVFDTTSRSLPPHFQITQKLTTDDKTEYPLGKTTFFETSWPDIKRIVHTYEKLSNKYKKLVQLDLYIQKSAN